MKLIWRFVRRLVVLAFLVFLGWSFFELYPYLFSKIIEGKIEKVERVQINVALLQDSSKGTRLNPELYSFAVAIKTEDGRIWTASAEDRQWASVTSGQCAKARYFPYPPWDLDKAGTYYGARLLEVWECK